MSSAKSAAHERKSAMTPTQRDSVPAKSPVLGGDPVASHSPFDPHHRPVVPGEVYRAHLPPHLDPTLAFHRVLDPGTTFESAVSTTPTNKIIMARTDESTSGCLIHKHYTSQDPCPLLTSAVPITICEPSVHTFSFFPSPVLCRSVHVSQAAVPDRLPQHLPAVHHGEHATDHPQRLHHFPADASHPPAGHGARHVTAGTARRYPLPSRRSR